MGKQELATRFYQEVADGSFQQKRKTIAGKAYHPDYTMPQNLRALAAVGVAQEYIEPFLEVCYRPSAETAVATEADFYEHLLRATHGAIEERKVKRIIRALRCAGLIESIEDSAAYQPTQTADYLDHTRPFYKPKLDVWPRSAILGAGLLEGALIARSLVIGAASGGIIVATTLGSVPVLNAINAHKYYQEQGS